MSNTSWTDRLHKLKSFSAVTQILLINGMFFVVCNILANLVNPAWILYFELPSKINELALKFYTPLTYMFTHIDLGHAFFNMIYLYFMGEIFVSMVGEKRLWFVYIVGGLAGAIFFSVFYNLFFSGVNGYLLGASASVTAVSIVCAMYAPNLPVSVFFFGPFPLKWVVLVLFLLSTVIDLSVNTGGKVAHLGGAFFGLLYGMQLKKGNDLMNFFSLKRKEKADRKIEKQRIKKVVEAENEEKTLNDILDKINKSGYDSLTQQEKQILQKIASKK